MYRKCATERSAQNQRRLENALLELMLTPDQILSPWVALINSCVKFVGCIWNWSWLQMAIS